MYKSLYLALSLMLCAVFSFSAQEVAGVVEGTAKKIDAATGTIIVQAVDGTDHSFHFVDRTVVYGTRETATKSRDTLHGLKEGSEVVVYYTSKGTVRIADEIDHIGKDGLMIRKGTIKEIDHGTKTLTMKSANGAEETYRLSERAARDADRDIGKASEKSGKATVYYMEEGGHKVAHFFKKVL
jgi:hypothetical protein